jgi:glycine/D-amino acid oxidase-like deaminating enzyme
MTEHSVVIAGGGPTGLMLAGELALAGVDVAIVERRPSRDLPGSRALLHNARPVLLNLGEPGGFDITPWADRVQLIDARHDGMWELPAIGAVTAPTAVLIRPDGYVAWVGEQTQLGLVDALTTWFGPATAA